MEVDQAQIDQEAEEPEQPGTLAQADPALDAEIQNEEDDSVRATQPNPDGFFAETSSQAACSVRVALRVRPLIKKELFEKQIVRAFEDNNTVTIGGEKLFTFDACFSQESHQEQVFDRCVKNLVLGCFLGYNATVLAYGQTGSGKTWTMGSGYTSGLTEDEFGIIPRVIRLIFDEVEKRKGKTEFIIKCSFLEIYNEELNDLLDANSLQQALATGERSNKINIREEKNGSIAVYGLREEKVENAEELATCLDRGSNFRTTASTLMNNNSSRSHAIFTISIEQHQIDDLYQAGVDNQDQQVGSGGDKETHAASDEFMVAKFHFVDLAGSERAKKTGAVGAQLKEGININKSLLVLGNVISALSDEGKKGNFVPYRDSKLTRILQDSLGGNSRTSMIACVSPAESNFDETLNTLNYASRARKIKNKPKVNRDPNSALIAELRQQCYEFQKECLRFRKLLVTNDIEFKANLELPSEEEMVVKDQELAAGNQFGAPPKAIASGGGPAFGMSGAEIRELEDQIKKLKIENSSKAKQIQSANVTNQGLQAQLNSQKIETFSIQQERDAMRLQIDQVNVIMDNLGVKAQVYGELEKQLKQQNKPIEDDEEQQQSNSHPDDEHDEEQPVIYGLGGTLVEEYQSKLQELRREMDEKELLLSQLQNDCESLLQQSDRDQRVLEKQAQDIEKFKRNAAKLQKENITLQNEQRNLQKQVKAQSSSGPGAGKSNTKNSSSYMGQANNTTSDPFKHSFKRSFNMTNRQKEISSMDKMMNANQFAEDLEENLKKFNDKFMETLTLSLTKQLGFDLTEAVEYQRKQTVGSSFIEKKSDGLLGLQFGKKEKGNTNITGRETSPKRVSPFGPQHVVGSRGSMAASVLVTGQINHRTPQMSQTLGHTKNMKISQNGNEALSVIDDAITANEQDTVHDENVYSDDETKNNTKNMPKSGGAEAENVSDEGQEAEDDKFKISVLTQEEQHELLSASISKRASVLLAEEAKKSQLEARNSKLTPNTHDDVEMLHSPEKQQQQVERYPNEEFEEVNVQDCSEDEEDEADEEELRDVMNDETEELFAALHTRDREDINEKRAEHDSVLVRLDGTIKDKENLLVAIKESQNQMQNDLISLMKEQYQHQVLELTNEITQLEKQKADNLSKPGKALSQQQRKQLEDQFKQKQRELEKQLKEAKEKNKQQQAVKKQVDTQNSKIRTLESEIQKIKIQKTSAQKKFKEQSEKYNVLRKQRADEVLRMKKASLKKDKEIDKLKKDAKRKEVLNKRRQEEIKVLQTQKNMVNTKKANASKMRKAKLEIDTSQIKDWIRTSIDKMIEMADAEQEIKTQTTKLNEVQEEIEQESNHKASLQLLKEKLLVKKYVIEGQPDESVQQDLAELDDIDEEIAKIELEIDQYQQNVNSLSEKQDYINTKISEVSKEIVQINMDFAGSLGKQNLQSPEGVKALVDSFFQILQEASVQLRQLQIEQEKEVCSFEQLKEDYQQQQNILEANEKYFHAKMQNIENEFQQKEILLNQLIEETKQDQEEKQTNQGGSQAAQAPKNMQRILTAKEEVQKSKDSAINESKMFLSKRLAELEKQNIELEKHNFNVQNKLNFALSDKEQLKLTISSLKNQLRMTNEIAGDINLRSHIQQQYGLQGSQAQHTGKEVHHVHGGAPGQGQNQNAAPSHHLTANRRIPSLAERRADLKGIKNEIKNARKEGAGQDSRMERAGSVQLLQTDPHNQSQSQNSLGFGGKRERTHTTTEDPRVIPVDGEEENVERLSSRMSFGDDQNEDEEVYTASVSADQELGKLRNSSFSQKYSTVAGKRPAKDGNDLSDQFQHEALEAYQTRPRKGTVADKESIALKQKGQLAPHGSSKAQVSTTPRQPSTTAQNQSGTKKSGGVFARLTNRKATNYESNLKRKLGLKQSSTESQGAFGQRKQSAASIRQSPAGAPSITFSQGKVNETIYSNRSHYNPNENQPEVADLLDTPQHQHTRPFVQPVASYTQEPPKVVHNWGVELVVDQAHNQQIYDIATVGNMLYSTSLKNLKIWDVNTMQLISDIKAHSGVIKCVKTMYTHPNGETVGDRIFVTAGDKADKTIQIWDMTTITNMTSLKGHKGEIRALEFSKDGKYLFSAGQGGMFVWDLRNTDAPIELIEKQQDIFALKSTQKQLFMGCRGHSIVPMGLGYHAPFHEQVQPSLQPPHLDVVTSFATLLDEKILISASKDRNLRGWSTGQAQDGSESQHQQLQQTKQLQNLAANQAHTGDINVLESSHEQREMYSGSKDGIVHIWNLREGPKHVSEGQSQEEQLQSVTLQRVGSLSGQGSAVTAIAALEPSFGRVIIYGSADKSLRFCKRYDTLDHNDQLGDQQEYSDFPQQDEDFSEGHYGISSTGQHLEQIEQIENMKPSSKCQKDSKNQGLKKAGKLNLQLDLNGINQ